MSKDVVRTRCTAPKKLMQLMLEAQVPNSLKIDSKSTPKSWKNIRSTNFESKSNWMFNCGANTSAALNFEFKWHWLSQTQFCATQSCQQDYHSRTVKWDLTYCVFFVFHPQYSLQLFSAIFSSHDSHISKFPLLDEGCIAGHVAPQHLPIHRPHPINKTRCLPACKHRLSIA